MHLLLLILFADLDQSACGTYPQSFTIELICSFQIPPCMGKSSISVRLSQDIFLLIIFFAKAESKQSIWDA